MRKKRTRGRETARPANDEAQVNVKVVDADDSNNIKRGMEGMGTAGPATVAADNARDEDDKRRILELEALLEGYKLEEQRRETVDRLAREITRTQMAAIRGGEQYSREARKRSYRKLDELAAENDLLRKERDEAVGRLADRHETIGHLRKHNTTLLEKVARLTAAAKKRRRR